MALLLTYLFVGNSYGIVKRLTLFRVLWTGIVEFATQFLQGIIGINSETETAVSFIFSQQYCLFYFSLTPRFTHDRSGSGTPHCLQETLH